MGFLSQVGILFWSASAATCLLTARVLPRRLLSAESRRFFIISGLLTITLGLDDAFLIHEVFDYFVASEIYMFSSYAGLIVAYIIRFYETILKTEYVLMGMSLMSFGISIVLDLLAPPGLDQNLYEDSAKLVGVMAWLSYFFRAGTSVLSHHAAQASAAPDGYAAAAHSRR